jgi:predicted alpha/beta superfamily hydrolase
VNVLLPDGYDDPKQAGVRYPVLYLLDGGAGWQDFLHIAGMVHQGGLWGGNAPMIVVGIESKDRRAEFTQPSADPGEQKDFPTHGKAETFRRFLTEELKPAIEAAYRTNGDDGLIGESLAGLFVVDTALRHGGDFKRYIAISPSLWWDGGRLSRDAATLLAAPNQPPRTLWLALADEGDVMQAGIDRIVSALKTARRQGVVWSYAPYPNETHGTIYHPAATRAIREVFPAPPQKK